MTAQKWFGRIAGLLTVVILTRLLTPSDFGLVAIAMSVIPFLYLLADLGFTAYLVQADDPKIEDYSTAFWYSLVAGVVLAALLGLIGPPLEIFLKVEGVASIMWGLAPAVLFVAVGSVPSAILRRGLRFDLLAKQAMIAGTIGQILAIILALRGFGVWALVAQTLVTQLIGAVLAWVAAKWSPALLFSPREFRRMAGYGSNVVAVELIALSRVWAENAIIATTLGLSALGYLSIAQRLIQVAQDLTATAITPVSTVVFAQIRKDKQRLLSVYETAQSFAYALLTPVMIFIAVCAPILIPLIFGGQWTTSIPPAQALAIAGVLTTIASLDNGLLYGLGRPGVWLLYALVIDVLTVAVTFFVAPWGLGAVAIGFIGVAIVANILRWPVLAYQLNTTWTRLAVQFARAVALAILIGATGVAAYHAASPYGDVFALFAAGSAISLAWLCAVHFLFPLATHEGIRVAKQIYTRIKNRAHGHKSSIQRDM